MILHLQGEHSASEFFTRSFYELFPDKNIIIKIPYSGNEVIVVKHGQPQYYWEYKELKKEIDFSEVTIVVVHYMDFNKERFLNKCIPPNVPIVWWMYGHDLYERLWLKGYKLYAPQTLPFVHPKTTNILYGLRRFRFNLRKRYLDKKVLNRIVGVIPCAQPDYKLACKLLERDIDLIDIYPRDVLSITKYSDGEDICVGHSASMTSNHLYALSYLNKIDTGDSNIWLPLSYTIQSEEYRKAVVEQYSSVFGINAHFIFEYQDLESYQKSFLKYKIAIYPSWRQEALGNIFICLQLGVKVFLSLHNPCFEFFREKGFVIFALEDIESSEDLQPLSVEQKRKNRYIYMNLKEERDIVAPANIKAYFKHYT